VSLLAGSARGEAPAVSTGRRAVTLLSGFLGSGKTTLLRHELQRTAAESPAVVINDFGSTMVDDVLLGEGIDGPLVVAGGCICCTRRDDLARALAGMLDAEQRGDVPRRDQVVIETSGLSDPGPIAFTIANDPVLKHHYVLDRVCVTVDAVTGAGAVERHEVAVRQLLAADDVLVTKADLVAPEQVDEIVAWVRELNPAATVRVMARGVLQRTVPAALARQAGERPSSGASPDNAHTADVHTLELSTDEPLDWQAFSVWLSLLLHRHGADVLRVKGVLDVQGAGSVALNGVQHIVHRPEHLAGSVPPGTRLVVITRGISMQFLERSFHAFLALP
jgi:G3E family GTPase